MNKIVFPLIAASVLVIAAGCSSYQGDFVLKSEAELAQMEEQNKIAHHVLLQNNYSSAEKILKSLTRERTVSRPLYQLELLSVLLLSGKHDEAHKLMLSLNQDFETLFDTKLEEKAQSVWHGEVNKVFKGDHYERATFYVFMALSFIRQGNYEDALRCVKNGLLAGADANNQEKREDYGLLHYLGYFAASRMNNSGEANEYLRALHQGLEPRGFFAKTADGKKNTGHCFEQLNDSNCNTLLVIWSGLPPEVVCTGDYKEKRSIIRGKNDFDMMSIAVGGSSTSLVPNNLGDLDYQATTRGGRLMDDVLADQAAAKTAMKTSGNILFAVGTGLLIAGGRVGGNPVGISLLGAGVGCYVLGGSFYVIGYMMNPAADPRFWRNIPCQLYIVPLNLSPGKHQIMLTGYNKFDAAGVSFFNVTVPEKKGVNVVHLPMMKFGGQINASRQESSQKDVENIIEKADANRMMKEIK